jgi:hypothetical protein
MREEAAGDYLLIGLPFPPQLIIHHSSFIIRFARMQE